MTIKSALSTIWLNDPLPPLNRDYSAKLAAVVRSADDDITVMRRLRAREFFREATQFATPGYRPFIVEIHRMCVGAVLAVVGGSGDDRAPFIWRKRLSTHGKRAADHKRNRIDVVGWLLSRSRPMPAQRSTARGVDFSAVPTQFTDSGLRAVAGSAPVTLRIAMQCHTVDMTQ